MSKCKETVNINGEIVQKYEVIKLNNELSKQRFLLKSEDGAKYFITAFGNNYISELSKFKNGDKVRLNAGREVSHFNGKEHINYYVNSLHALPNIQENVFFERYIGFLNVNKIEHTLTLQDVEMVYNDFISQTGLTQVDFDNAVVFMVKKWKNSLYFHLRSPEKLREYIATALKLEKEDEN